MGGDTTNLTGLTEFLFFRAFYHINKETMESKNLSFEGELKGTKRKPDLVVYEKGNPIVSVEIKSNYYTVEQDYGRHEEVVRIYPNIITATIAFEVQKKKDKLLINDYIKKGKFYQCLILNESNEKLAEKLDEINLILH